MVLVRSGNHRRLLVVGVVGDGADVDQLGVLTALERQIAQDGVLAGSMTSASSSSMWSYPSRCSMPCTSIRRHSSAGYYQSRGPDGQ